MQSDEHGETILHEVHSAAFWITTLSTALLGAAAYAVLRDVLDMWTFTASLVPLMVIVVCGSYLYFRADALLEADLNGN